MVGILEQLGALGGLNQGLLQAPGGGNLEQQQVLQQYAKALLDPKKPGLMDSQARGAHKYSLVHPGAGLADMMNALAGRNMLRNTFDTRNQNELNPGTNVIPPSGPQAVPTPRLNAQPVDPDAVPVQPPFNGAPDGGADNNAQPEPTSFGGEFNAQPVTRSVQPNAQPTPNAGPRPTNVNTHTNDDIAALVQAGYPTHSASALADRRVAESGSNYHSVNPNDSGRISAGGLQWNRERLRGLFQHASENNIRLPAGNLNDPRYVSQAVAMIPPAVQRSYMIHELNTTEREAGEALRRARNPHEAYSAVMRFVRPANQSITPAMTSRVANLAANFRGPTANNGVPAPNTSILRPPTQASIEADEPPPGVTWSGRAGLGATDLIPVVDREEDDETRQIPNTQPGRVQPTVPPPRTAQGQPIGAFGTAYPLYNPAEHNQATHPDTPPSNYGLSPREMQSLNFMSPENRQMTMQNLERQYTPQYTEGVGGRRWVIPRTGQTGWVPEPRYGTIKGSSGEELQTITIHGPNGQRQTYILSPQSNDPAQVVPPRVGGQGNQPVAPVAPRPPTQAVPIRPPNQPARPVVPPEEPPSVNILPSDPNSNGLRGRSRFVNPITDDGSEAPEPKNPNLINAQYGGEPATAPSTIPRPVQPHPLDNDFFVRSRQIQHENERLRAESSKLGETGVNEIANMRERGVAALDTRQALRELDAIESLPGIDRVFQGRLGEAFLAGHQTLNSALNFMGVRSLDPERMVAAEQLFALNGRLAAVASRQLTNRPTQFDFQTFLRNTPGLVMSREGRAIARAFLRNESDLHIALADATRQPGVTPQNILAIRDEIYNNHRLVSPDGTVMDHTISSSSYQNGRFGFPRTPVAGQIIQNRQWTGTEWGYVNANDPATWLVPLPGSSNATPNSNNVPIPGIGRK